MNRNIISLHMTTHAGHSGYVQLAKYIDCHLIDDSTQKTILSYLHYRLKLPFFRKSGVLLYNCSRFETEFLVMLEMLSKKNELFHFLNGDNSFRHSGKISRLRKHKLIATFHLPPSILPEYISHTKHLDYLDGLIVVGSNQIEYFKKFISEDRIFCIPHGVDLEYFVPISDASEKEKKTCLFVGYMMRDFQTLNEAAAIVYKKDPSIKFLICTGKDRHKFFTNHGNITLKSKIPDEELLGFYQTSTILVQPMVDCTANNTILESLACGTPVISTDIGGIRDYIDESIAIFVPPKDPQKLADSIIDIMEDRETLQKLTNNSRNKIMELSWKRIAKRTEEVYAKV